MKNFIFYAVKYLLISFLFAVVTWRAEGYELFFRTWMMVFYFMIIMKVHFIIIKNGFNTYPSRNLLERRHRVGNQSFQPADFNWPLNTYDPKELTPENNGITSKATTT